MVKSVVSRLVTEFTLDDKKLKRSLDGSESAVAAWGRRVQGITSVGAVISTAGVIAYTGRVIESAKEVDNLSKVANVSVEEFQALAFATDRFNISQEKTADILKDTSDKIGDFFQTGGGPLRDFFENIAPKVGLTADAFRDLNSADALQLYVSSLEGANVSQSEFTFFMEAIASDATMLLPLLKNNGEELNKLKEEAFNTGNVFSDFDISKMRELSTTTARLKDQIDGVAKQAVVEAIPAMQEFTDILSDPSVAEAFGDIASAVIKSVGAVTKAVTTAINVTKFWSEELAAKINGPAVGDIIRIEDLLYEKRKRLTEVESGLDRASGHRLRNLRSEKKELAGEIELLEAKLSLSRELQGSLGGGSNLGPDLGGDSGGGVAGSRGSGGSFSAPVTEYEKLSLELKRQISLYGETSKAASLRFDLENKLIGINDQAQVDSLLSQAQRLDELNELREASRQKELDQESAHREQVSALREVDLLEESLLTEEESILAAYERRQEMLDLALENKYISEERHANLLSRLQGKKDAERQKITAKGFSSLLDIAGAYYQGVNTQEAARVRLALQLGKTLLDAEQRNAIKSIAINTWETAMKAYNALSGIPYVGPFLGAAAAGVVIAAGAAYGANVAGIAHGGLTEVPEESTFLLQRGERVLSPNQNRDFTNYLRSGGGGGGNVVVQINEAPGVVNEVDTFEEDGATVVSIDQRLRGLVQDELRLQSEPGGILDQTYAV